MSRYDPRSGWDRLASARPNWNRIHFEHCAYARSTIGHVRTVVTKTMIRPEESRVGDISIGTGSKVEHFTKEHCEIEKLTNLDQIPHPRGFLCVVSAP
jgi:hypothetical protein